MRWLSERGWWALSRLIRAMSANWRFLARFRYVLELGRLVLLGRKTCWNRCSCINTILGMKAWYRSK